MIKRTNLKMYYFLQIDKNLQYYIQLLYQKTIFELNVAWII